MTLLTALAFLTHLVGDVVASGPAWPVYPLWPFADVAWSVSWSVNASDWRNITLSVLALALTLAWSWRRGYSPLECLSYRVDDWLAAVLRGEFHASARFRLVLYSVLLLVSVAVLMPLWLYLQ